MAHQAPLPLEFARQEYWSGLPFLSPGDLTNPGTEPGSPALQADSLPSEPPGKPKEDNNAPVMLICCLGEVYYGYVKEGLAFVKYVLKQKGATCLQITLKYFRLCTHRSM